MEESKVVEEKFSPPIRMIFVTNSEVKEALARYQGRILGVLSYSAVDPGLPAEGLVHVWVPLEVIGAEVCHEIWISESPVNVRRHGEFNYSADGDYLFGCYVYREHGLEELDDRAYSIYSGIFELLDSQGYSALLRVWNYFPLINGAGRSIERYREFNVGRHEAFYAKGRAIVEGNVPAACALGTDRGYLVIGFLAGREKGIAIENPRQVNAYGYPGEFGPRSPTFSRGMLVGDALLISGTASIVGSKTVHPEDIMGQLDETLENLRMVDSMARGKGFRERELRGLYLNVYLRRVQDLGAVQKKLEADFGIDVKVCYMRADICRSDLLIEIEAFWFPVSEGDE